MIAGASPVLLALGLLLLVAIVVLAAMVASMKRRLERTIAHYRALATGVDGANLEEVLNKYIVRVRNNSALVMELRADVQRLEASTSHAIQRVGFVRFNPFQDVGGDQSFSLALLNREGTGIVLNSLFTREGTRVYAKPIELGQSPYPLTEEEQEAIRRAQADEPVIYPGDQAIRGGRS